MHAFFYLFCIVSGTQACTDYLMAAATQYLAVPLFSIACMLLLHKSSPTGTGVCFSAHLAAQLDPAALVSAISSVAQTNTTALAVETASQPYLSAVLGAMAAVEMGGGGKARATAVEAVAQGGASELVSQFAMKLSTIYALPAVHAVSLCRSIIFLQSLLWFVLCLGALLAWTLQPTALVGSASARAASANPAGAEASKAGKED